ncbi:MAG: hypothetical protein Q7S56_04135 [Nanoarchaeota archaeon]|nr:hypothetical protein [Nanoarchaeota archaeon]
MINKRIKRGSHVGIILSFVIFVVFLVYLFGILQPAYKSNASKETMSGYVKNNLIDYLSANLTIITISAVSGQPSDDTVEFDESAITNFDASNMYFVVKNTGGSEVDSIRKIKKILIKRENGQNVFDIYYSTENLTITKIYNLPTNAKILTSEIKLITYRNEIFESKVNNALKSYNSDYTSFKRSIGISNINFGFSFKNAAGVVNGTTQNTQGDVYAQETPVPYFDKGGNLKTGFFTVKIW